MPYYRRLFVPGGTYFFTVNLLDRRDDLLTREIVRLRAAWAYAAKRHPFETVAAVVLPDHLHCVWRLPPDDDNFPTRWRLIKTEFSRSLAREADARAGRRPGERAIWQRRFWEHLVRDENDLERHIAYIHFNPVKHGHVRDPDDWPYSTWHDWKKEIGSRADVPPEDWRPMHLGE
ncbi:MAG: transposase [Pseudomonadota bacterium]|nr:transposase [Pseudomonadota bacterium]